jgi:hypothetical protein
MKTAVFAESMREQRAASPHNSSLWGRDSKSPEATHPGSIPGPGSKDLAAVEHHRSRIPPASSFRKTGLSAGRTDGPLNTPHTRTDARFSHSLCLIPAEAKRSPAPCSADGQPAGYEAKE